MTTNITRFMMDVGAVVLGREPADVAQARGGLALLAVAMGLAADLEGGQGS